MEKEFKDIEGNPFTVNLTEHDITKYERLFHVSIKRRKDSILEKGLLINQEPYKSLDKKGLLFFSYPITNSTSDCFRWYDDQSILVVLDVKKLTELGITFYDDHFGRLDQSSNRNHLCCAIDVPKECIVKVMQYDKEKKGII